MNFVSRYVSHPVNEDGYVDYTPEEHRVWSILYERQMQRLPGLACDEFLQGLECLNFSARHIPRLDEVSRALKAQTGWDVHPVAALIPAREFFELLSEKHFPAATFIRVEEELDYVKEPDVFHELFGHCPMLTNSVFADFVHQYAVQVLQMPEEDWPLLQRLFWYTVEFGLINTDRGLRAYGGGILSSIQETAYSVQSDIPLRVLFDPIAAFRMPYRIDQLQMVYFVIESYQQLYSITELNFRDLMQRARLLGEYQPLFEVDENNPCVHINAC